MKTYLLVFISLFLISCADNRECSFDTLDDAVNCGCAIIDEKLAAKEDKEIINNLKSQTKLLNDQFDKAIKDSVFTEKEFIQRLKTDCESFNQ